MMCRILRTVALCICLVGLSNASHAQAQAHLKVRDSLAYLTLSGEPGTGNLIGQPGGTTSQATGFFIGDEGFILTAAHFFDPAIRDVAVNVIIEARVGGSNGRVLAVSFVSDLPDVDLLLLRANIPFGDEAPAGLALGNSSGLSPGEDQVLLTSGFNGEEYDFTSGELIERGNSKVPFAWNVGFKVGGGQSGSPVYVTRAGDEVEIVGIIKASSQTSDERTLIVPIEYSMPLIGHLKIDALERRNRELEVRLDELIKFVGTTTGRELPLDLRVQQVAENVTEIARHFSWSAESDRISGSIIVRYDKLLPNGPQVEQINVNLTPNMRSFTDPTKKDVEIARMRVMQLTTDGQNAFAPASVDPDGRWGEFVIPGAQDKLQALLDGDSLAVKGRDPFRDLELIILPTVAGATLLSKKLIVVPNYDWK